MRNRIDNILLGVLWLLAATLGTNFWLNTKFGFNIFSVQHWQYLAYLQASKTHVTPIFYISIGLAVFITILGLYILIQPKFRKIALPIIRTKTKTNALVTDSPMTSQNTPISTTQSAPVIDTAQQQPVTQPALSRPVSMRPPHLTLQPTNSYSSAPAPLPTPIKNQAYLDNDTLRQIFESAGYTVKKNPYINGFRPDLMAIGTNEVLWIGAIGATTVQVRNAIDKISQIFSDTLEDVYININGFAINAPDAATSEFEDILMFNSTDALAKYITEHPNPAVTSDEQENFDAYSEYIDTVIGYIGKL